MRKDELLKLETDVIQDLGTKFLVKVKASKTHKHRIFTILDNELHPFLYLIKRYITMRPVQISLNSLFINYKNDKCSKQPIGINTFSKLPSLIATFLKLEQPHLYTGHCFRRSSASILSNCGADFSAIKRLGGWKSTAVAEGYIENSLQNKVDTAKKLLCKDPNNSNNKIPDSINTQPHDNHDFNLNLYQYAK
jgi:site-specific recombinase XerD